MKKVMILPVIVSSNWQADEKKYVKMEEIKNEYYGIVPWIFLYMFSSLKESRNLFMKLPQNKQKSKPVIIITQQNIQ